MKTQDAIAHFGNASAVALAARISKAAVSQWGELVPLKTAFMLEHASQGKLMVNLDEYFQRRIANKRAA